MQNIIPPAIQKQAIEDALQNEYCPEHNRRISVTITDEKLQFRYCCKAFADKLSVLISDVNNELFLRFKRGEF